MKTKIRPQSLKNVDGQVNRFTPFENALDLATLLQIDLDGREVGAYILAKGNSTDRFCFVFGFDCQGIHTTLRNEQVDAIFNNLELGLKDLPQNEEFTLHLSSFTSDTERQQQLAHLVQRAPSKDVQFLVLAEQARTEELTTQGIRKPKSLKIYVTYTIEPGTAGAENWIEKILAKGEKWWYQFTGESEERNYLQIEEMLKKAFQEGFQKWEQIISNKMGLAVNPMTTDGLWQALWTRFNRTTPQQFPQKIVLDESGVREEVYSDLDSSEALLEQLHSSTVLLESEVPVADREWVHVNGRYIGVLTFVEKPGGWPGKLKQLRYLWEFLAREDVSDTEVFCQLTAANPALIKATVQRITKQSTTTVESAKQKTKATDVGAQIKIEDSVEAQRELYKGAFPVYTGLAILVHRRTQQQLDDACRRIENCFQRPAWVIREKEYAWKLWLQTLPVVWSRLLARPFDRRQLYLTNEVPGLMPLVTTRAGDKTGFELISDEGGTPVHLDLFKRHKNLALFATTRAGKSVLVSGILTQALAHGMPIVALDYPKPDGTSTFTDYTYFMDGRGAYFDISKQSNNLFEQPDLRNLPENEQAERFQDYAAFLESALMTMVLGSGNSNPLLSQTVRSILSLSLSTFFDDPRIQKRYQAALEQGFGSDAWLQTPTLKDFLVFCTSENIDLAEVGGKIDEAFQQIRLRLKFWLKSRVGRAISQPSSFPTDAQLLVFALRNLSDEEDAAVLSLSAYSAALRRALSSPASIFFIDEAPILFEFEQIADLVSRLCANGAKAGVRVILSAQDPDTIARARVASKIFQNLSTRLIGRIQPVAIDSFENILKYPREVISRNASESFFPKKEGIYSQWLLDDNGAYTFCRYYPAYEQLAVVANNPDEQEERTKMMRAYGNKFEGLSAFASSLIKQIRES